MLWTLTGAAIRIAQLMDLPWDGSRFKLPPFETEIRRRLWWTICSIESRYAEENGFQPASTGQWSETHFPLNVDDEDLHPDATEPPQPRLGCTDMTFPLISFEIVSLISRINNVHPQGASGDDDDSGGSNVDANFQKKVDMVEECQARLETNYLQYCSSSRPFDWMTVFFARLVLVSF
jgi:Fungal specific transcription factor domain